MELRRPRILPSVIGHLETQEADRALGSPESHRADVRTRSTEGKIRRTF